MEKINGAQLCLKPNFSAVSKRVLAKSQTMVQVGYE